MTYQITTLPNGLRVASECLPNVETVAVTVSAGVGARHESEEENGISHLLEHMAFKGTKTRSARDIAESFDNIGGHLNAYTSMELTVYYAKVLKGDAPLAVEILADIIQNSTFDEEELAREKNVIIQEIAMHLDSPEDLIVDYFDETAFPNQPLGRSILSTPERIHTHTRRSVMAYMQKHYVPTNLVISAAGNITHENFVNLVSRFFTMPAGPKSPGFIKAIMRGGDKRVESDLEQLHLMFGLPAVSIYDPLYYAMQLYSNILGGGMSSRLFQEVREKQGLAYTVYSMGSGYADLGVLGLYAATSPDKARDLSLTLSQQVAGMAEHISDTEIHRAKNQLKAELLMAREAPQTVAGWIGRHLLMHDRYKQIDEVTQAIDDVSKEDILVFANQVKEGQLTVAALGPISEVAPYEELAAAL